MRQLECRKATFDVSGVIKVNLKVQRELNLTLSGRVRVTCD